MNGMQIQLFNAASSTSVLALNNSVRLILFVIATLWVIWVFLNSFSEIQSGDSDKPFSALFHVIFRVGLIYVLTLALIHR